MSSLTSAYSEMTQAPPAASSKLITTITVSIFAAFLAVVFPVVALAIVWRVSRPDMGYYRWHLRSVRGVLVIVLDLFALAVSLLVGWGMLGGLFS